MSQPYDEPLPLDVTRVCAASGCTDSPVNEVRRYCRPHQSEVDAGTLEGLIIMTDPTFRGTP